MNVAVCVAVLSAVGEWVCVGVAVLTGVELLVAVFVGGGVCVTV